MHWHRPHCAVPIRPIAYLARVVAASAEREEDWVATAHFIKALKIGIFGPVDDIAHSAVRHLEVPVH